jgi:metal-responsive CopG/Arc/MetJ family transcriptional regulator
MGKEKISVTLRSEQVGELSDLVGDEYENRSEAVRGVLDKGFAYDEIQATADRLERQLAQVIDEREERQEIVAYVEEEQSWREAPLSARVKWWVFGKG